MTTEEWAQNSFLWKSYYMSVACKTQMWTYYVGFCFMESTMIATGLGFNYDKEGEKDYNTERSVNIWGEETATEVTTCLRYWNMSVHHWLKYYVMIRLMDKDNKGF